MLLVIFGAGASYDSSADARPEWSGGIKRHLHAGLDHRPPLANDLFDRRPLFDEILGRFPHVHPIATRLRHRNDKGLEEALEELLAEPNAQRPVQLAAVRLYLQALLWECQKRWRDQLTGGVTNYGALLDRIECWRERYSSACFVTFNYDTMLEEAFGRHVTKIDDLLKMPFGPVFKLHGSVDWARLVTGVAIETGNGDDEARRTLLEAFALGPVNLAHEFVLLSQPTLLDTSGAPRPDLLTARGRTGRPLVRPQALLFPALAIPLRTKGTFECPTSHIDKLKDLLLKTTRILIIGWRGHEQHFLNLLAEVKQHPRVMVVARDRREAEEIRDRLSSFVAGSWSVSDGGFSHFVTTSEVDSFLSLE